MRAGRLAADWLIALAAGAVATRVTDWAQRKTWELTPAEEKAREPALEDGSSARSAAHLLCDWCGIRPTPRRLEILRSCLHQGLGLGWGSVYGFLRRRHGMSPLGAGVITGTSLSLLIDEALNPALGITPPGKAYPASSHVRGLVVHLVYGLTVALAAEALHRAAHRVRLGSGAAR